jgi:nucleotide-binding universal stress UspA family protein
MVVMPVVRSEMTTDSEAAAVSAKTMRAWCAPESILAVTDLTDEMILLPHLISQSRLGSAKIILAHLVISDGAQLESRKSRSQRTAPRIQQARAALDRMAQHLRWLGFVCEPLVIFGRPEIEVPALVKSLSVDRVILRIEQDPASVLRHVPTVAERILPGIEVPVCVIGRCVSFSSRVSTRNITLALSSRSDCAVPLGFSSRLAQELNATLTVLHVSDRGGQKPGPAIRTPEALAAILPTDAWREAELFCSTELALRQGDAADEILQLCSSTHQDLVILCSGGNPSVQEGWRNSVTCRVLAGAQCPVLLVGSRHARDLDCEARVHQKTPVRGEAYIEGQIPGTTLIELGARSFF